MSKKIYKEILKILQLPFYSDETEFKDKLFSYLYIRFKFKEIGIKTAAELGFNPSVYTWEKIVVKLKDTNVYQLNKKTVEEVSDIQTLYTRLQTGQQPELYLYVIPGKDYMLVKKIKQIQLLFDFLSKYLQRNLEIYSLLSNKNVQSIVPPTAVADKQQETMSTFKDGQFLIVNPKNLPESIRMVEVFDKAEKEIIKEMIKRVQGKKIAAAKNLGITERMIGYKLKKYKL
ncbi:MAG: helix-turn-helix domain-containing protein [Candidatus Margulisbacteria bacterium]|nr:helix-turn-helix domain-containing protein [Candidatus Margulisiibacteriota bacterium]